MVRQRAGHPWIRRLGVLLIVCGLIPVGYVAWEFYGTNIISHRRHHDITAALKQRWGAGKDFAPVDHGAMRADALIRIPRFGADYAVPVLEGSADDVLDSGFGHFTSSAAVGAIGNYALAAHRVTHGEPLRGMPALLPGDKVIVESRLAVYIYVLDTGGDDLIVPFTDTWVIDTVPRNPDDGVGPANDKRLLTLTTCAELFHTDNRMVAFGHLESVRQT